MRTLFLAFLFLSLTSLISAFAQEVAPRPMPRPDLPGYGQPAAGETLAEEGDGQPANGATPTDEIFGEVAPSEDGAVDLGATPISRPDPGGLPAVSGGLPQPITLSAKIVEDGPIIPSGITWRIFDARADASGELSLIAKSDDATAVFSLPPGQYMVHAAYGYSQTSDTLIVEPGPTARTFVMETGALQLNAKIYGNIPIPANFLDFEIFGTSEDGSGERTLVAENVLPGQIVQLNSGIYNVVSHFGGTRSIVRADLKVEPGQTTEATLFHRAAQVSFRLASEVGGEAIADVDWTIKNSDGETIFTSLGAFPSTVLAEGDYLVLAKRGTNVYNRDFSVTSGPLQDVEVLTSVY